MTSSEAHIGSTAVPRLAAKPVIDFMAGVETLEASRGHRSRERALLLRLAISG